MKGWEDHIKEWKRTDFVSSVRAAKTGKGGEGILQGHLRFPTTLQGYGIQQNRKLVVKIILYETEYTSSLKLF